MRATTDTSIQTNLYRQAIVKKPSHRNWREWDALYDAECKKNVELSKDLQQYIFVRKNYKYDAISAFLFGIAIGLIIAVTLINLFP